MIVHRSMHPDWLSNTYLVADEPRGTAVIIDAGAPIEPLMALVDQLAVRVTHVLLTHQHHGHPVHVVELEERYGATLVTPAEGEPLDDVTAGGLTFRARDTPGHCSPHVTWVALNSDGEPVGAFTGDALFRGTVGGTLNGGAEGLA